MGVVLSEQDQRMPRSPSHLPPGGTLKTVRTIVTVVCLTLSLFLLLTVGEQPSGPGIWKAVVGR